MRPNAFAAAGPGQQWVRQQRVRHARAASAPALDIFDTDAGTQSPSNIPPGAPGYIEPGSTPDKIRLFAQRSAMGQPHSHKELFGSSGQVQSAQAAAGDG